MIHSGRCKNKQNLIFIGFFILFLSIATNVYSEIRIGSFNADKLGCNNNKNLYSLSKIIKGEDFSIIAIQEVCNEDGINELKQYLGKGWKSIVSNPIGRKRYKECYAFLYDESNKVRLGQHEIFNDSRDDFAREPFIAEFYHNNKVYWLINIHIVHGGDDSPSSKLKRKNEVKALGDVYLDYSTIKKNDISFTIILGDFNLTPEEINMVSLPFKCYQTSKSTVKYDQDNKDGYKSSYDHFCLSEAHFEMLGVKFFRVKAPEKYYNNNFMEYRSEISNHVPIRMDINASSIFDKSKSLFNNILK